MVALSPATASAGSTGKINFAQPVGEGFVSYVNAPTSKQAAWMRRHYARMRAYAPYFDSRLSWYPNAWAYENAYAIYRGGEAGKERYILRDSAGRRLYIPFGCSGGTCPQYAADIGDPGWRNAYIDRARVLAALGYKGVFVDDVNFEFHVGDGNGDFVAPVDDRTGEPMTHGDWQRYMAEFMEQLRAALPSDFEIVHNQVWFQGGGLSNPYIERAIEAATHLEIERGVIDPGITGGGGQFGYESVLAWADHAHSRGKGVIWDAQSTWGREYQMATYLLASNGMDYMSHPDGANPGNWWSGYDTDLGQALGARYSWNGVLRRDFQSGIVLVNQPEQTTKVLELDKNYANLAGSTVGAVTLGARRGAVLVDPSRPVARGEARAESGIAASQPASAAKLEVARAHVSHVHRRLSVLAPISGRATGGVEAVFEAAGRRERFDAKVERGRRRVRINRRVTAAQARLGTGIVTLRYAGDANTQPQEVRLRAAPRPANLRASRPRIEKDRLIARGTISRRAKGVVRLQLLYEPSEQRTRTLEFSARIRDGRYGFDERLSADVLSQIAQRRGVVHSYTLFTGDMTSRLRGESSSFQVRGAR